LLAGAVVRKRRDVDVRAGEVRMARNAPGVDLRAVRYMLIMGAPTV